MTSQQRFTTSEVAVDWHEPMVSQRIMWPSTARANEQLDLRLDLPGQQFGILCMTVCVIQLLGLISFDVT